jgi:hypothetical protein
VPTAETDSSGSEATGLRTPAWEWGSFSSHPGTLQLSDGRLSFIRDDGKPGFDAALEELAKVGFPRSGAGMRMNLRVDGKKYRISFVKPSNGSEGGMAGMMDHEYAEIGRTVRSLKTYPAGKKSGNAWKQAMETLGITG